MCSDLPCKLYSASVAVSSAGDLVYVTAGSAPDDNTYNNVFCYTTNTDHWTVLPQPGHCCGVLHMLNDRLTIFGGNDPVTKVILNKVTTYNNNTNSWYSHYPDMLNKRFKPGVITSSNYVIVMGGMSSLDKIHDSIELMDYQNEMKWKNIIIKLPTPMWAINPTISGNDIITVGYISDGGSYTGHYQIAIEEMILSFNLSPSTSAISNQWKEKSPAPHFDTVTVPYTYPPLIIGGRSHSNQGSVCTTDVSLYDSSKNAWKKINSLTSARHGVGVAFLNNSSMIVIGGCSGGLGIEGSKAHSLTTVEIGNIVHNN